MSATLTYKGNTLTTVNNETKVLNTSGTWLEDNITITDVASGITPAGTISIDDEGTYNVTNYASAEVDIDYSSKVREITFVINRQDTSSTRAFSIYGMFSSTLDFSQGIRSIVSTTTIAAGESTKSYTIHCPKQRPIIVIGTIQAVGNYDVTIDSSYGECIDVPHILGSTNTAFTKAIYLKAAAPDAFTITITLGSQAAYPESVITSSLSVTTNGTYTASSGTAYNEVTVNVPSSSSAIKCDTGTFTMQSDSRGETAIAIAHNLGEVPKTILVWTEDFDSTHNVPTSNTNGGFIFAPNLFNDLRERLSSSVNAPMNVYTSFALRNDKTPNLVAINTPTSTSYFPSDRLPTSTQFYLPYVSSTYYWRAGITYKYLLVGSLS